MWREDPARDALPGCCHTQRPLPDARGLSTGAKTAEGIERIQRAKTKHGRRSQRAKAERAKYRDLMRACREMLAGL